MSFHPKMSYDATFHKSARVLEDEGPPFAYTPGASGPLRRDRQAIPGRSAPIGGAAGALPRAAPAGLHHRQRHQARRGSARDHEGGCRGRRHVLHDVLHEAGREVRAAGVPHAVLRAERRRARHGGAQRHARDQARRDRRQRHLHARRSRVPRRLRSGAGRDGQRRVARRRQAGRGSRSWSTTSARVARPRCAAATW